MTLSKAANKRKDKIRLFFIHLLALSFFHWNILYKNKNNNNRKGWTRINKLLLFIDQLKQNYGDGDFFLSAVIKLSQLLLSK